MAEVPRGRLIVIHGSMFAGKTETMIARLRLARQAGRRVVAFKNSIDDRYDADHLVTHRGDRFDARRAATPEDILVQMGDAQTVAIDEAQFFGTALIRVVESLLCRGIDVIAAGITNDAWGRPFEPMPDLARLASEEVLLRAPCRVCGQPAAFTQRLVPVTTAHMVGGLEEYEPRCGDHFVPLPGPPEQR